MDEYFVTPGEKARAAERARDEGEVPAQQARNDSSSDGVLQTPASDTSSDSGSSMVGGTDGEDEGLEDTMSDAEPEDDRSESDDEESEMDMVISSMGNLDKTKKRGKFLGNSWEDILKKQRRGGVSPDTRYLPKAGGSRLADDKSPLGQFDQAVMGMNRLKMRADAVSAWNGEAVQAYRGRLFRSPGSAGDIAREQRRWEHPGAVA